MGITANFYTQGEVAALLQVNRLTINRWMHAGRIRYERIGGVVLIEKTELERLKQERSAAGKGLLQGR